MQYTQLKAKLAEAEAVVTGAAAKLSGAKVALEGQSTLLGNLATAYEDAIAGINAGASAYPEDEDWQRLQGNKDKAVADRATFLAQIDCMLLAYAKLAEFGEAAVTAALNGIS